MYVILDSHSKDPELGDEVNDDLLTSNATSPEKLCNDTPLDDSYSKTCVKDLPDETPIISSTSDTSLTENSHDVNSVDR